MKAIALVFLSLIIHILTQLEDSPECVPDKIKYQCTTMQDEKCMIQETLANGTIIVHLMSCMKDDYCYNQEEIGLGFCFKRQFKYFHGEKCKISPECHSKNCTKNRCVGLEDGSVCDSDYVCLTHSYCDDGICAPIAKPGGQCSSENGCPIGYACGREHVKDENKKCIKVFSIETGQYTSNRLFCKSGFALYIGGENFANNLYSPTDPAEGENFICAESTLKSEPKCTKNSDCEFEVNTGANNVTMKGKTCICTGNGNEGYCQIATDNPVWTRWLELYAKVVKDGIHEKEHVAYNRPLGWGNPALIQAEQDINRYEKFMNADSCAKRYLTGASSLSISRIVLLLIILSFI